MALLEILKYPDSFLSIPAKPVEKADDSIRSLIDNMAETMFAAPGIGLAASQVGEDKQVIVYSIPEEEKSPSFGALINPVIVSAEGRVTSEKEGCLSVPDFKSDVRRAESVIVEGLDRRGKSVKIDAKGLLSIIIQHETDHLNGILFIDRISALKRSFYKKRVKKISSRKGMPEKVL